MRMRPVHLLFVVLLIPGCGRGESRGSPSGRELRIFVASSLTEAFQELADSAHARDSSLMVRLNADGSPTLVTQLKLGAPADLLVTADERWMKAAQEAGVAGPATAFASSGVAIVVTNRAGSAEVTSPVNLASPGVKVVLAAPDVPLGRFSRALLGRLAMRTGYGSDFAARVEQGVVSQELSAEGVMSKLRLGEADAGILFRAQLLQDTSGTLRELPVAGVSDIGARYYIAPVTRSADTTDASAFRRLVGSPVGAGVLRRHGFSVPDSAGSGS